ncbi:Com family DNA-binding transcriptional regulator [Pantoea sp. Tr-811]|uniref:Com family DNA-binding transcriptional regulator n=1 Tax=Pantoea sp. Tr-811 TaxID=2608361 RepID=UPI00141EBF60|nr:Com family DNA-binding transcriptional regulator [Pantoea sp. Tr-811]
MLRDIRCGKCNRLLARAAGVTQLQIKCSRCGTLNHVKTLSLEPSPLSETQNREVAASNSTYR